MQKKANKPVLRHEFNISLLYDYTIFSSPSEHSILNTKVEPTNQYYIHEKSLNKSFNLSSFVLGSSGSESVERRESDSSSKPPTKACYLVNVNCLLSPILSI